MERFGLLDLPKPASRYEFPSMTPSMPDTSLNLPYHLSLAARNRRIHTVFPSTTREFFRSLPHLRHHRLMSRLATVQNGLPHPHYPQQSTTSANPPNQWPSPVRLVSDPHAVFSSSPILNQRLQMGPTPSVPCPSALSCAASEAERALPFSKEAEGRIPLVGGPESFPMVLHRALAELELVGGGRDIATFLPDGRSFYIKKQELFASKVLPVFFPKMKGFASFQRQLNLYNFRRVGGAGLDRGAYRHDLFIRDYPARSCHMRRTKIKGSHPTRGPSKSPKKKTESETSQAPAA